MYKRQALDRGNKIVIVGVGKSGNIGAKIGATLNSTGTPTVLLDSLNALHGDLGIVQDGDVCISRVCPTAAHACFRDNSCG